MAHDDELPEGAAPAPSALLGDSAAAIVSSVAGATRLSLQCTHLVASALFTTARYGTSASLGLSRRALVAAVASARALHHHATMPMRALSGVAEEPASEHQLVSVDSPEFVRVLDTYTNLGIYYIHSAFSLAELLTLSAVHISQSVVSTTLRSADETVRVIDGLFGSTETSRALAAIVALVKRELYEDEDFQEVTKDGTLAVMGAVARALIAFACLQVVTWQRSKHIHQDLVQVMQCELIDGVPVATHSPFMTRDEDRSCVADLRQQQPIFASAQAEQELLWEMESVVESVKEETGVDVLADGSSSDEEVIIVTESEDAQSLTVDAGGSLGRKSGVAAILHTVNKHMAYPAELASTTVSTTTTTRNARIFTDPATGMESALLQETQTRRLTVTESQRYQDGNLTVKTKTLARRNSAISLLSMTSTALVPVNPSQQALSINSVAPNATGRFPDMSLPTAASRYMRHASAAYGTQFLHVLGIMRDASSVHMAPVASLSQHHPNHYTYAMHTGIHVDDVLLSSYTPTPMVGKSVNGKKPLHALNHYVSYDRAARAVVVTLRGTLGLTDVLTDLCIEYATMELVTNEGLQQFSVHSGMYAGARLLARATSDVARSVCDALEREPGYGLILTGHSLGAGVAALIALLWSQPLGTGVMAPAMESGAVEPVWVTSEASGLPPNRRVHCLAFGSPCVAAPELGTYARGLITTVMHGQDVVGSLSLGVIRDFRNVALSLYTEPKYVEEIVSKCLGWNRDTTQLPDTLEPHGPHGDWFWALIKTMRADMRAEKLFPPGRVYIAESKHAVEVTGVTTRERIQARLVRVDDVEGRFGEVVFGAKMFTDHSPKYYEDCLHALAAGATR